MLTRCPNPQCAKVFNVAEAMLGRKARCKNCDASFIIQEEQGEPAAVDPAHVHPAHVDPAPQAAAIPPAATRPAPRPAGSGPAATQPAPPKPAATAPAQFANSPAATQPASLAHSPATPHVLSQLSPAQRRRLPAADQVAADWAVGDVILGIYNVQRVLGEGGMGKVYEVWHNGWNLRLAVKSPRAELLQNENEVRNFERECETWAELGLHPHIVSCYYVRRLGGIPRVFAECVEGGDLGGWIHSGKLYEGGQQDALARILDIAIQFAWGLDYSHAKGLIHQDVKPSNVLLAADGAAKVTDFGLAKARGALERRAEAGSAPGGRAGQSLLATYGGMTQLYCSPEQADRRKLSRRTDIWSWAVSVLEMFMGEAPWPSGNIADVFLNDYLETGPRHETLPAIPPPVADLLRACLRQSPDDRPRNMHEVAATLIDAYAGCTGQTYSRPKPQTVEAPADLLNNRALSFWDLGRADDAIELWNQALGKDAHHLHSIYNLGLALWRQGRTTDRELLDRLEAVGESRREGWEVDCLRANVHVERGDPGAASEALRPYASEATNNVAIASGLELVGKARGHRLLKRLRVESSDNLRCAFHPDGQSVMAITANRTVQLRSAFAGEESVEFGDSQHPAVGVCLSQDGKIALAAIGTSAAWRRLDDRRNEWTPLEGHLPSVTALALSPSGKRALAACQRPALTSGQASILRLWDVALGRCLHTIQVSDSIHRAAFAFDDRVVLTAGSDGTLREWDFATGQCRRIFARHVKAVRVFSVSPDGNLLLSGGDDGVVRLWDSKAGTCAAVFDGHNDSIVMLAWEPDSSGFFAWSKDGACKLWSLSTGRCQIEFESAVSAENRSASETSHRSSVRTLLDGVSRCHVAQREQSVLSYCSSIGMHRTVAVSKDGQAAVTGGGGEPARLWRLPPAQCLRTFDDGASLVRSTTISTDGRFLLTIRSDNLASLWRLENVFPAPLAVARPAGSEETAGLNSRFKELMAKAEKAIEVGDYGRAHEYAVASREAPGFERDRRTMAALNRLTPFARRIGLAGTWHSQELMGHSAPIDSVTFLGGGPLILSASKDHKLRVWNAQGQCERLFEGPTGEMRAIGLGPDGAYALSADSDNLWLWNLTSVQSPLRLAELRGGVVEIVCCPDAPFALLLIDEKTAVSRFSNRTLHLRSLVSGIRLRRYDFGSWNGWGGQDQASRSLAVSPDGRFALASAGELRLFHLASGAANSVVALGTKTCISPDGQCFAQAGDLRVELRDFPSGGNPRHLTGGAGAIRCLAFSPDSRFLVTGGADKTVRIWDVRRLECLQTFAGHADEVTSVAFDRDGNQIVSGGKDAAVRVWRLDWRLEFPAPSDWDPSAASILEQFLTLRTPYAAVLPNDREPSKSELEIALTRRGRPAVSVDDFEELLATMRRAGFGWLRPEGIKKQLLEIGKTWNGPPSLGGLFPGNR